MRRAGPNRTPRPSRGPWWPSILWGGSALLGVWLTATHLRVENPSGQWQPTPVPPSQELWDLARRQFGDREVVLVALQFLSPAPVDTRNTEPLEDWIREQPEVAAVFGPSDVARLERGVLTYLPEIADQLRETVISRDESVLLVYATLEPPPVPGSLELKKAFLSRLEARFATLAPEGAVLHLAGKPALDVALNALVRRDSVQGAPSALLAMFVLLALTLARRSLPPSVGVIAAVVVLLGGLALLGVPLSTATVVALPITVVVGLSFGLHVSMAIARSAEAKEALDHVKRPLLWAYVTTALALLSLALSPIPALRTFALASAAGVSLAMLAARTLVPAVSRTPSREERRSPAARVTRSAFRVYRWSARHPRLTTVMWIAGTGAALAGTTTIQLEPNNYLGFFSRDHPVIVAHRVLDEGFGGSVPLHVLVTVDSGTASTKRQVRRRVDEFRWAAREQHDLGPFLIPVDPGHLVEEPAIARTVETWFRGLDPAYSRAITSIPVLPTSEVRPLISSLDSLATAHSDKTVTLRVTGVLPASLPLLRAMITTQLRSLASLVLMIVIVLPLAVGTWRLGVPLILPSIVPLTAVAGAMGFVQVPLDFTTVTIFSMLLGVSVDDTIHIAAAAKRTRRMAVGVAMSVRRTAAAVSLTSFTAAVGFSTLVFSPFPSTRRLGALMALGLLVAWLAALTLTPLLLGRRARTPERLQRKSETT